VFCSVYVATARASHPSLLLTMCISQADRTNGRAHTTELCRLSSICNVCL